MCYTSSWGEVGRGGERWGEAGSSWGEVGRGGEAACSAVRTHPAQLNAKMEKTPSLLRPNGPAAKNTYKKLF